LRGSAEALEIVVVDEGNEVVQSKRGGHQRRLPGRALLHLAIAQDRIDKPVSAAAAFSKRHADRHRETMAERSGRCLDAWVAIVRMAPEPAVRLAVEVQVLAREHAEI